MHENYHARWDRPVAGLRRTCGELEIPLLSSGIPIGRLSVSAERDDQPIEDALLVLVKIVEVAEIRASELTSLPGPVLPVRAPSAVAIAPEPVMPARALN